MRAGYTSIHFSLTYFSFAFYGIEAHSEYKVFFLFRFKYFGSLNFANIFLENDLEKDHITGFQKR